MKWIKTAIGAVIAISLVPLVVLSVINIKKSLETEKITFTTELDYVEDTGDDYGFDLTIDFDELIDDYIEKGFTVTNLYDYTNDINITITNCNLSPWGFQIFDNNSVCYNFSGSSMFIAHSYDSIYNVNATDIVLMDIILTKSNFNLAATLISFIPIIFAGGVVLCIYKLYKKD